MKNIIFIGGIHGVGKGTICNKIVERFNLIHITASEVLNWKEISNKNNKIVKDLNFTQNRLLLNLEKIISDKKEYLLDGHYCLLNSYNIPEKIDKQTFITINPKAFVIIIDDIEKIKLRLEKRDNIEYDIKILQEFQSIELDYSKSLSRDLNIPHIIIKNGKTNDLFNFLKNENIT